MKLTLLTFLLSVCMLPVCGQQTVQPLSSRATMLKLSEAYRASRNSWFDKALELAKEKHWQIFRSLPGGGVLRLERVDALGLPVYTITTNNIRSAATTGTDLLWPGGSSGLNLQGSSAQLLSRLGIWDGGAVLATHQEFGSRIDQKDEPLPVNDHSTHVAGTLIAAGINRPAKGMAFGASDLVTYDFLDDNAEMAEEAATLLVSNHSYGAVAGWRFNDGESRWEWHGEAGETEDYKFGYYDITARDWDEIAYNAPFYLIVKSAGNNRNSNGPSEGDDYYRYDASGEMAPASGGAPFPSANDGYDILPLYANAKNILLAGAVNPVPGGYQEPSDVVMTPFSSWGPTDDGRIKPDIMGNGVGVLSTSSDADDAYIVLSGTSMAASNVAGSLFLLQELYSNTNEGRFMRSATLRGLAIHTAGEAGPAPGPDYQFGWGLLNVAKAAEVIVNSRGYHLISEATLEQGTADQYEVIASGNRPLEVSICWTDPPADTVAEDNALDNPSPRLVNDLDVRVTRHSDEEIFLPWVLDPADPSAPAGKGDNILDNVEKVVIPDPEPGTEFTVRVSHKGTLRETPQHYSIIMSGTGGKTYCSSAAADSTGTAVSQLQIGTLNYTSGKECSTYTSLLEETVTAEPGGDLPFTINTAFCGTGGNHIIRLFADWNVDGDFTDQDETLTTSNTLPSEGTFSGSIAVPSMLRAGTFTRIRIVAMETGNPDSVQPCGTYQQGETLDVSLEITQANTDIAAETLVSPAASGFCSGDRQRVSILIRNKGTEAQDSIPLSVDISTGNTSVATMSGTFDALLQPGETGVYTFPQSFTVSEETDYNFKITANQPGDQDHSNNVLTVSRQSLPAASPPEDSKAFICEAGESILLAAPGRETIYWYDQEQGGNLIGTGDTVHTVPTAGNTTFYAAFNDFKGMIGPGSKADFPPVTDGNAYNQYTPSVNIETHVPLLIESARLYTGNPGKISFTVYDNRGNEIARNVLHVTTSRNAPAPGRQPDDPSDTGKVYFLYLSIPRPGSYSIAVEYEGTEATIFRNNNGVEGYPFSIPGIMDITGNSSGSDPGGSYYYFYDMRIKALGCTSPRTAVQGAPLPPPPIRQEADTLFTDAADHLQWFLNGEPIAGANGTRILGLESGAYHVVANIGNCSASSETYQFTTLTDLIAKLEDNGLKIYPNPGRASTSAPLKVEFYAREQDIAELNIVDMLGKTIYRTSPDLVSGKNTIELALDNQRPGTYIVNLRINKESFAQKFIIHR